MGRLIKLTILVSCVSILGSYMKMNPVEFAVAAGSDFIAGLTDQPAELRYTPHRDTTNDRND